jgi:hypothetical protein
VYGCFSSLIPSTMLFPKVISNRCETWEYFLKSLQERPTIPDVIVRGRAVANSL